MAQPPSPNSILEAIRIRYASSDDTLYATDAFQLKGRRHTKQWEMVGMESVSTTQSTLQNLTIVSLVDMGIVEGACPNFLQDTSEEDEIVRLKRLRDLNLSGNPALHLSAIGAFVSRLPQLTTLQLNRLTRLFEGLSERTPKDGEPPSLTAASFTDAHRWASLRVLTLNHCDLPSLAPLTALFVPKLEELHLDGNPSCFSFGCDGVAALSPEDVVKEQAVLALLQISMPLLEVISAAECAINSWAALALVLSSAFPLLKCLHVQRNALPNFNLSPSALRLEHDFVEVMLPRLSALDLRGNVALTAVGESLRVLADRAVNLVSLRIDYDAFYADFGSTEALLMGDFGEKKLEEKGGLQGTEQTPDPSSKENVEGRTLAMQNSQLTHGLPEGTARLLTIASFPQLQELNRSTVRVSERRDAERRYLALAYRHWNELTRLLETALPSHDTAQRPNAVPPRNDAAASSAKERFDRVFFRWSELQRKHGDYVNGLEERARTGRLEERCRLTIRCEATVKEATHLVPMSTPLSLVRQLAAKVSSLPPHQQRLSGWSTEDAAVVAAPMELEGEMPLSMTRLGTKCTVLVEPSTINK